MYFIIKYNVFNKYIINVTTTKINTYEKNILIWSKGGNFLKGKAWRIGGQLT